MAGKRGATGTSLAGRVTGSGGGRRARRRRRNAEALGASRVSDVTVIRPDGTTEAMPAYTKRDVKRIIAEGRKRDRR